MTKMGAEVARRPSWPKALLFILSTISPQGQQLTAPFSQLATHCFAPQKNERETILG